MSQNISQSIDLHQRRILNPTADAEDIKPTSDCRADRLPDFIRLIVSELFDLYEDRLHTSFVIKDSHTRQAHIRHVAIYLSNVAFGISMRRLATAFNHNRSTIAYACKTVEERRDELRYDRFLEIAERVALLAAGERKL